MGKISGGQNCRNSMSVTKMLSAEALSDKLRIYTYISKYLCQSLHWKAKWFFLGHHNTGRKEGSNDLGYWLSSIRLSSKAITNSVFNHTLGVKYSSAISMRRSKKMFSRLTNFVNNAVEALAPEMTHLEQFRYHWKALTQFFLDNCSFIAKGSQLLLNRLMIIHEATSCSVVHEQ